MVDQRAVRAGSITVVSDYVCPFCYLGRESLRQYQATRDEPLRIDWHPFDLRAGKRGPDGEIDHGVDDGKDGAAAAASPERAGRHADDDYYEQAKQNVRKLADRYGVEMTVDIARDVDSLDAQVVSRYISENHDYETWLAFDEAVFDALWTDGEDIGDTDLLIELAAEAGVDDGEIRSVLDDDALRTELRERFEAARQMGITGVPTFVYDGTAARGAVPPEHLERLVEES